MRVAGFVLVGGQSLRMGRDKARLPLGERLLVQDVASKVRVAAGNVTLVGSANRYSDLQLDAIDDLRPSLGPLAGIESALSTGRGEFNLIVACDMPDLETGSLSRLIAEAARRDSPCMICQDETGSLHPLCAVWKKSCLAFVKQAIDENRLRVLDLVAELEAVRFRIDCPVHNVNTPRDWAAWQNREPEWKISPN